MSKVTLLVGMYLTSLLGFVQPPSKDQIEGVWWNEEKTSRVEVYQSNGKYYGKIVYLKDDTNPDGSSPRTDYNNPDESKKNRKLIGTLILKNLVWDEDDNEWDDGEIYDPKSGKTYSCYAVLQKDGKLFLKGYVLGMPFLGRSTLWTRYNN